MLGHTHVLCGMAGWLAVGPVVLGGAARAGQVVGVELPAVGPAGLAASVLVCGGAAMLPDVDHPRAVIARTYGPVWHPVAVAVNRLAGGHRKATHSLAFAALAGLGCAAGLASAAVTSVLVGVFIGLAVAGLAAGPLHLGRGMALPVTAVVGFAAWGMREAGTGGYWWLPLAVCAGSLIHCLGDACTPEGVPWLWPNRRRYGSMLIARTGNELERGPVTVALIVAVVGLVGWRSGLWVAVVSGGSQSAAG